ncbi:tRNA (adenosine(37)-N6)-threonylcarbamoyltransferase complex dimerization subunit type 1 TsaB [Ascidiimonas aurantiaca]|uniref:tRNA (adenosine(37)-N6)-threonylcarbamoyltransferase complex dimerization subunit type 1 TsaB n=1 Tax=Ascidiimonas aurantiaca TaxID=1685432 RepID=UPI0030ED7DD7
MAVILSIETSSKNCSVCVSENENILSLVEHYDDNYSHAENLHVFIKEALQRASFSFQDLSAIAVSKGPGSYTGLRIGVSAAKGLCYALEKPLIAISTLEAMAHKIEIEKGCIVPMLDARRMEVYAAVFDNTYREIREIKAEIINENSFSDQLAQGPVHFIGTGVSKCIGVIKHPNAVFYKDHQLPSAKEMAKLANEQFKKGHCEDVAYFEPFYLKDFIGNKSAKKG